MSVAAFIPMCLIFSVCWQAHNIPTYGLSWFTLWKYENFYAESNRRYKILKNYIFIELHWWQRFIFVDTFVSNSSLSDTFWLTGTSHMCWRRFMPHKASRVSLHSPRVSLHDSRVSLHVDWHLASMWGLSHVHKLFPLYPADISMLQAHQINTVSQIFDAHLSGGIDKTVSPALMND